MKLPYKWIQDYVDIYVEHRLYAHAMTMSGSKVEGYGSLGAEIEGVVLGQIDAIDQHPNADKLVVCTVNVGGPEPIIICTGATNLKTGDYIPVAMHGSKLPGGITIKKTKMRGVESNGMLCSIGELGLTLNDFPNAEEDGILTLDGPVELGADAKEHLGLSDTIFEFEITPNRPDCLSAIGIAKETAATFGLPFKAHEPKFTATEGNIDDYIKVSIADADLCRRYTGAIVKDVKIEPSPLWLRQRLRDCGVRPINNIVDITNLVMLEYGQPMHAFDYACITDKEIVARRAKPGEEIETLDGSKHVLPEGALIIADKVRPIGVAGVMGGANSEITENTKIVAFEAGNFEGVSIRNTSRKLGMRTEASARFEKGLDCEKTMPALARALELVEQLGAGTIVKGITDVYPVKKPEHTIAINYGTINGLIGISLKEEKINHILSTLDIIVKDGIAHIPSDRDDIEGNADLAEEVARIYGYDNIPTRLSAGEITPGGYSPVQKFEKNLKEYSYGTGYSEVLTLSFIGDKVFDKLLLPQDDPKRIATIISNPLGEDQRLMRTTTLHSILEVAARNYSHRVAAVNLFEIGTVYRPAVADGKADLAVLPQEYKVWTLCSYGSGDFYRLKGAIEAVLKSLTINNYTVEPCTDNPSYHPGRTANLLTDGVVFGTIGQVHPLVAQNYGIDTEVYCAELDFNTLYDLSICEKLYTPLPKFPATTRDLALVCNEDTPVLHLQNAITEVGGKTLESVELFDIFRSPKLGENKKSVAFSLSLRNSDHTITDEEADKVIRKALINLEKKCNAVIRS